MATSVEEARREAWAAVRFVELVLRARAAFDDGGDAALERLAVARLDSAFDRLACERIAAVS
jgi:hypothetical protein